MEKTYEIRNVYNIYKTVNRNTPIIYGLFTIFLQLWTETPYDRKTVEKAMEKTYEIGNVYNIYKTMNWNTPL